MNEKYYTLVNGVPKELPNPIKVTVSNPTKEQYEYFGYKPKTYREEDIPEYNPETQYLETTYVETDAEIIKTYEVKDIEDIELPEMNEETEETIIEEGEKIEG